MHTYLFPEHILITRESEGGKNGNLGKNESGTAKLLPKDILHMVHQMDNG